MGLKVDAALLVSRVVRKNLLSGKVGGELLNATNEKGKLRKIGNLTKFLTKKDKDGNLLGFLWDWGSKFVGFVVGSLVGVISFSAQAIWGLFIQSVQFVWNFDWNASDEALTATLESQNLLLASVWGGVLGQGVGWAAAIAVGAGVSLFVPVIGGAALARLVAAKAGTEALEELIPSLKNALQLTTRALAQTGIINFYISFRRGVKMIPEDALAAIFGKDFAKWLKNTWGNKGGPRMSFAEQVNSQLKKIDNKFLEAFLEEFLEEAWEGFVEGGFVVASEIDAAFAQAQLSQQAQLGPQRSVSLLPDKTLEGEILTFEKIPQTMLISNVQQTINTHRLINNRDVGMIIGQPVDDYVAAKPQSLRIVIQMMSKKEPPYEGIPGQKVRKVTITIPDLKRSALDWEKIKLACGGANGYNWGRYRANCTLSNGHSMTVFGATADEAEDRLKAFVALSNGEILTITVAEEKKEGVRLAKPRLQKESTRIYPAWFTILNREAIIDPDKGRQSKTQRYLDRSGKILLWTTAKPPDADDKINFLLRRSST